MRARNPFPFLGLLLLFPLALSAAADPEGGLSIFDQLYRGGDEVLEITVETEVAAILADKTSETYYPATLVFQDKEGAAINYPMEVRMRGRFRRRACDFPPLKIKFADAWMESGGFNPRFGTLKLVTHCLEEERASQENVLLEYLAYRLFNELTDNSFRVQLVRVTYVDRADGSSSDQRWGFIIEDPDEVAARIGASECEEECMNPDPSQLDLKQATLVGMFQYMIGNSDWSIQLMRNLKLMRFADGRGAVLVPYDFDFAGLIDAEYAIPNNNHSLTSIRQRAYLGVDVEDPVMQWVMNYFEFKREALLDTVRRFKRLRQGVRYEAVNYLVSFYDHIDRLEAQRAPDLYDSLSVRPLPYPYIEGGP